MRFDDLLVLVPSLRGLSSRFRAHWLKLPGARFFVAEGISDVCQARNIVGSRAFAALQAGHTGAARAVLWLDDDVEADAETVHHHKQILEAVAASHDCGALAGRYVNRRRSNNLAATADPSRAAIATSWGELAPVFAGLGALMQTIASFAEHCERSPERGDFDPAEQQEPIRVLCCPRTEPLGDGKVRYFAEDYDYCSRVPGGVFLAPPAVRYGHVSPVPIYPAVEAPG